MARVEVSEVEAILSETIDADKISLAIDTATLWIDENLVGNCSALGTSELRFIELYLSAHLAVYTEEGGDLIQSARADVSERYAEVGKGHATRYITTAAAFDPCGIVAERWMDKKRVRFKVGTTYQADA